MRFVLVNQLDEKFRTRLATDICDIISTNATESSSLKCNRLVPSVYRQTVIGEDGKYVGVIEILLGEEVIDSVVRFLRKTKIDVDEITLKNYMLRNVQYVVNMRKI